jgi:MSHA biogenesis protein MshP
MYLKCRHISLNRQHGSMLVMALFVVVVLAFLGLTLNKMVASSSNTIVYEVLGQRALNAAKTGIECQIAATIPIAGAASPYCMSPASLSFINIAGLENCRYSTSSSNKVIRDGVQIQTYYQFTSTGQCEVGEIVVSRTVYVDVML